MPDQHLYHDALDQLKARITSLEYNLRDKGYSISPASLRVQHPGTKPTSQVLYLLGWQRHGERVRIVVATCKSQKRNEWTDWKPLTDAAAHLIADTYPYLPDLITKIGEAYTKLGESLVQNLNLPIPQIPPRAPIWDEPTNTSPPPSD